MNNHQRPSRDAAGEVVDEHGIITQPAEGESRTYERTGMEYVLLEESFATDYAYIDKKEFKQLRKDNKVDKSIEELLRFEKVNKIPPLATNLQAAVDQLFKKDRNE